MLSISHYKIYSRGHILVSYIFLLHRREDRRRIKNTLDHIITVGNSMINHSRFVIILGTLPTKSHTFSVLFKNKS